MVRKTDQQLKNLESKNLSGERSGRVQDPLKFYMF